MNKIKLLKTINQKEDKILDAIEELQIFLDSTEDEELSSMGNELASAMVDFLQTNDNVNIHDIKEFIEEEYDQA
jgi:hypothetical protein